MGTTRVHDKASGKNVAPPPPTNAEAIAEVFSMLLGNVDHTREAGLAQQLLFRITACAGIAACEEMRAYLSVLCPRLRGPLAAAMKDRIRVQDRSPGCGVSNPPIPKEF